MVCGSATEFLSCGFRILTTQVAEGGFVDRDTGCGTRAYAAAIGAPRGVVVTLWKRCG